MKRLSLFFFLTAWGGLFTFGGQENWKDIRRLYLAKEYDSAVHLLQKSYETAPETEKPYILLELGDLYFDKKLDSKKATEIYDAIQNRYPSLPEIPDILYRKGLIAELEEDFVSAASLYEQVATRYLKYQRRYRFPFRIERKEIKPKYMDDALDAIERTFKKNYQDRVAYVDGYPLTRLELDERGLRSPTGAPSFEEKKKILDEMIVERLLYIKALASGYSAKQEFGRAREDARRRLLFQEWYNQEVVNEAVVDEREKREFYKKHRKDYSIEEQVKIREILLKDLAEASSLRDRILKENLKFDSVAKEVSLAPTKERGGELGWIKHKTYPKGIEKTLFKLKPKEISPPLKTKDGYLLFFVEERKEKQVKKYKDVASEIEARLRQEKIQKVLEEKLKRLKEKGNLTIDTVALKENKETLAYVFNIPLTKKILEERLQSIPAFFRGELETPEGKKRFLDNLAEEYVVLFDCENKKYWLKNSVFGQLREETKRLLVNQLRKEMVQEKAVIPEAEVKREYQKTIKEFYVPEQVKAREIVVRSQEQAREVKKRLEREKIAFDSLVKVYSVSPSKWIGGDLGYFKREDKPKPIVDFAFKAKPGEISNVIKIDDTTFVLIKVEEHKKAYTRPFSEVKTKIERRLKQEKEEALYQELVANLKNSAKIEILLKPEEEKPEEEKPEE